MQLFFSMTANLIISKFLDINIGQTSKKSKNESVSYLRESIHLKIFLLDSFYPIPFAFIISYNMERRFKISCSIFDIQGGLLRDPELTSTAIKIPMR